MKKIITLLLVAVVSLGAVASSYAMPIQQHVKKDGTADKRFKENKAAKASAAPLTKAGAPDKRFKENKAAPAAKAAAPAGPLTKAGKPDMRHKANNPKAGKKKS